MKNVPLIALVVLASASSALADWSVGDTYKMHYPQLPDPTGIDTYFTGVRLADDFTCTETGPITDIHFWYSFLGDRQGNLSNQITAVHAQIYADIPATDNTPYSHPGQLLWSEDFANTQFHVNQTVFPGLQGWYDPGFTNNTYTPNDHNWYYQINIENIPQAFFQQQGVTYWLSLEVDTLDPTVRAGWKSSASPQYQDTAVWLTTDPAGAPVWLPIYDPRFPINTPGIANTRYDLAFVITPAPGAAVLLGLGAMAATRRRRS